MADTDVMLIIYTTKYRLGGRQFPVVAETLAAERRESGFAGEVTTAPGGETEVLTTGNADQMKTAAAKAFGVVIPTATTVHV